jgi:hypothetical protein
VRDRVPSEAVPKMTSGDSGPRLVDFLDHIAEASRLAREYVAGISEESF